MSTKHVCFTICQRTYTLQLNAVTQLKVVIFQADFFNQQTQNAEIYIMGENAKKIKQGETFREVERDDWKGDSVKDLDVKTSYNCCKICLVLHFSKTKQILFYFLIFFFSFHLTLCGSVGSAFKEAAPAAEIKPN